MYLKQSLTAITLMSLAALCYGTDHVDPYIIGSSIIAGTCPSNGLPYISHLPIGLIFSIDKNDQIYRLKVDSNSQTAPHLTQGVKLKEYTGGNKPAKLCHEDTMELQFPKVEVQGADCTVTDESMLVDLHGLYGCVVHDKEAHQYMVIAAPQSEGSETIKLEILYCPPNHACPKPASITELTSSTKNQAGPFGPLHAGHVHN